MALSKRVESYPNALIEFLETIIKNGESRELTCADEKQAHKTRMQIYGLRSALVRAGHPLKDKLYSFTINVKAEKLIFRFADDAPVAQVAEDLLKQVQNG